MSSRTYHISNKNKPNDIDRNFNYYIIHTNYIGFNYVCKFKIIQHIILYFNFCSLNILCNLVQYNYNKYYTIRNILDKDIDILNTKYHYGNLDKGWGHCQNYTFYKAAKNILDDNKGLDNDSDKILRALCYVYTKGSREHFDKNICNFLYFWLGDILLKKLEKNIFFQNIISNLFKTLTNHDNHQICELPHFFMLEEDFKDIKTIFDCSEDYKSYNEHLLNPRMFCNNNYKTYLNTNKTNYDIFYSHCEVEQNGYKYCEAFRKYFPHYKKNLFSEFNCFLKSNETESVNLGKGHETELVQSEGEESNIGSLQEVKLSVEHTKGVDSPALHHGSSVTQSQTNDLQMDSNSLPSDGSPSTLTSKSITGAVSVAGALVPSYLLYNVISIMINKYNALHCTS
ncbi:hypothetical protein PVBG_06088 [Plasmodium vivax Brazil I]|uniref:Uncharacterized protein n=1 Tax=Plasmodium vivax (strain Brazil I) TaxID=1033975 RepID=A0A0J9T0Y0_PLAV1|nr:hypothetical protein PVBG_06088 [Plasmodium vivax Brazil I]